MRREAAIAGFVILAAIAVAGWTRQPNPQAAAYPAMNYMNPLQPAPAFGYAPVAYGVAPVMYVPVQPGYAQPLAAQPYAPEIQAPRVVTADYRPAPVRRTVVQQQRVVRPVVRTTQVKRTRPTSHSVAIVAGSAGAGAAIGALAGGGKGAAIGALAGGAGGFIYDRLTRNR